MKHIHFATVIFPILITTLWSNFVYAAEYSSHESNFYTSVDTGIHILDEDLFIPVLLEQGFSNHVIDFALSGPFRLRIKDNAPADNSVLRNQDWDDPSDWARIIRKLHFANTFKWGSVDAFVGELNGVHMGYQNTVSHYYNSTDMDHYHGGFDLSLDIEGDGLELLLNDVVIPTIIAGRIYLSPLAWFNDHPWAKRLQVGAYLLLDRGVSSRTMNNSDTHLFAVGSDLGFTVLDSNVFRLTPYVALAGMDGDAGFHGGATMNAVFSEKKHIRMRFQAEYRYMGEDYYPALINPFYDNNRRFFTIDPATETPNTFADHLSNTAMHTSSAHGFMADIELSLTNAFRLGARYDFQSRNRPHWLLFRMEITPSEKISFRAFYAGQDVTGGTRIFSSDALIGLAYQHQIIGPLRGFTEFCRRFRRINDDETEMVNDYILGLGLLFIY